MQNEQKQQSSIVGRRMRERREALGIAQEKLGVAIGLVESNGGRVQHLLMSDLDHP
jgi:transcriptional regulator with XRE-family HTH domain